MEYKISDTDNLEEIWNMNVSSHPGDERWVKWKEEYIRYNITGLAKTFVVVIDGKTVGEGTLLFSSSCRAVNGNIFLADGKNVANVNALRIIKKYEGMGHISRLMKMMESYAKDMGFTRLTIGVSRDNERNVSIYKHRGYDRLILSEYDDGEWVDYYEKNI